MIRREIPQAVHDLDKLPVIPIAVSAHHVHLTREAVEQLFGKGYRLTIRNLLSQTGQWASEETVNVAGPKGDLQQIRILGPCRVANQIEIAESEGYELSLIHICKEKLGYSSRRFRFRDHTEPFRVGNWGSFLGRLVRGRDLTGLVSSFLYLPCGVKNKKGTNHNNVDRE